MANLFAARIARAVGCVTLAAMGGAIVLGAAGPAAADSSRGFYGDPDNAAQYWAVQSLDDCALMSVADVVGQMTGLEPSEDEIVAMAQQTPSQQHPGSIYLPPSDPGNPDSGAGTTNQDVAVLMAQYGIESRYTDEDVAAEAGIGTGMDALEQYLAQGRRVIAFVNAELIWGVDGDHSSSDHALVVTGVDTGSGIVHLNDSGQEAGADEQVPIATFQQAWATSSDAMVVTA